ncbi:MAG: hypothetical protein A3F74_02380 [Betaproteobacteria bacterium RIFCSPLOWO2_12_FULL_62_58]|nr:MAG: hypothetical protein A3F74_02380 [Betaproteobacteria bacterium RIFCSPLOWO2_12_FULL_62_58]
MTNWCVVVADGARARIFVLEPGGGRAGDPSLLEKADLANAGYSARGADAPHMRTERNTNRQTGPMHAVGEKREQHRLEVERRFGVRIAERVAEVVKGWNEGSIVLVADPRLLGLMREMLREAVKSEITLKELAKDYTRLSATELHEHLASNGLIPMRRRNGA